jgi:GNAT superfamily N-acetyltransferase
VAEPNTTIRAYTVADYQAAVDLLQVTNIAENAFIGDRREELAGATEHLDALLPRLAEKGGEMLLAEREGAVVGLTAWAVEIDDLYVVAPLRRYAIVEELVVAAAHRRQGIGSLLLAEVERRARSAGLPRLAIGVIEGNRPAEHTYAAFGFNPYLRLLLKRLNQP